MAQVFTELTARDPLTTVVCKLGVFAFLENIGLGELLILVGAAASMAVPVILLVFVVRALLNKT